MVVRTWLHLLHENIALPHIRRPSPTEASVKTWKDKSNGHLKYCISVILTISSFNFQRKATESVKIHEIYIFKDSIMNCKEITTLGRRTWTGNHDYRTVQSCREINRRNSQAMQLLEEPGCQPELSNRQDDTIQFPRTSLGHNMELYRSKFEHCSLPVGSRHCVAPQRTSTQLLACL